MKKTLAILLVTSIALAACTPVETFVKGNMKYSDFERDRSNCLTKATQALPVKRNIGGEIAVALIFGVHQTQDDHAVARMQHFDTCMMNKGYQRIQLPVCKDTKDARKNGVGPLTAHERVKITQESCAVNDNHGRIVFAYN